MKEELLTPFEKKILDEVVRPALSQKYESHWYGVASYAQDLNFVQLVRKVRQFYEKNCGHEWSRVLVEADKPENDMYLYGQGSSPTPKETT